MGVDPEDLFIFKAREEKKAKAKKTEAAPAAQPSEERKAKAQKQKAAPLPPQVEEEAEEIEAPISRKPQLNNEKEQAKKPEEIPMSPANFNSFQQAPRRDVELIMETETETMPRGKRKAFKSEEQSRAMAQGLFCAWHPWRNAYAMCNYCHRSFCYEDIIEYKDNFYCLEDIDRVMVKSESNISLKYNGLSVVSAALFLATFAIFVYFANAQLTFLFNYANKVGLVAFIANMNYSYATALANAFIAALSFFSSLAILAQSRKGFVLGTLSGILGVALFSYEYLYSSTLYTAVISIMLFLALVLLIFSREAYESEKLPEEYENSPQRSDWPNVSRF